jgi:hypothetical protein
MSNKGWGMDNYEEKPIPSIRGAMANSLGQVKFPDRSAKMPNGGMRKYKAKWVYGSRRRASKTARHEYFGVLYRGKNYKIHRLVCEAFHGPAPHEKPIVIHLDEDATNNRPDNLRWGTQKENLNMPNFKDYCRSRTGDKNPRIKGMKG